MSVNKTVRVSLLRSLVLFVLVGMGVSAQQIKGMTTMPQDEAPVVLGEKITMPKEEYKPQSRDITDEDFVREAHYNVSKYDRDDNFDVNDMVVGAEMYLWNRISDFLDILRCGIGGGTGIGLELSLTDYANLGAYYVHYERGVDFPHFLPPLWLINYYNRVPVFNYHETEYNYGTAAFGPWRYENQDVAKYDNFIYPRSKWDIRAQIHVALFSLYANASCNEAFDFVAGIVGLDPNGDDNHIDESANREPADQFGRGVCNILFGVLEVPFNVLRVTEQEGDLAGFSKGLGLGCWRFVCREVVGVVELVSFPFGWQPVIEPEYVFQKKRGVTWRVNRPAFRKAYK